MCNCVDQYARQHEKEQLKKLKEEVRLVLPGSIDRTTDYGIDREEEAGARKYNYVSLVVIYTNKTISG